MRPFGDRVLRDSFTLNLGKTVLWDKPLRTLLVDLPSWIHPKGIQEATAAEHYETNSILKGSPEEVRAKTVSFTTITSNRVAGFRLQTVIFEILWKWGYNFWLAFTIQTEMVAVLIFRKLDLPLHLQCNSNSSIPTIGAATDREKPWRQQDTISASTM